MIIEDAFPQRSPEWHQARLGIPTASRFSEIITTKGAPSDSVEAYMYELAIDKLLGYPEEKYISADMRKGTEREPEARLLYGLINGITVRQVALVYKNELKNVSCSPDGLIPGKGLEIQCPKRTRHVLRILNPPKDAPYEKFQQIQGCMWICGFPEYDFMSYYPGLPEVILTVKRDNEFIAALETEMIKFLRDLKEVYAKLKEKVG